MELILGDYGRNQGTETADDCCDITGIDIFMDKLNIVDIVQHSSACQDTN